MWLPDFVEVLAGFHSTSRMILWFLWPRAYKEPELWAGLLRHNLPRYLCQAISQVHFEQKQLSPGYDLQQTPNKITLGPFIDTDTGVGGGGGV